MKVTKLSASRVKQYVRCPQEYYYDRHSNKQPKKMADETALHKGSLIHEVMEELRYKPEKDVIPDLVNKVNEDFEDYTLSHDEVEEITQTLENWINTRDLGYEIIDVEKYFKIPIKDFYLTGKIDVIERIYDDLIRVTDYKTGHTYKNKHDVKNSVQLKLYTLASMEMFDVEAVEVAFDQLNFKPPNYTQYEREDLVDFLQYMVSIKNKIEDDDVQRPNPDWHCAWCDYTHHCPAMEDGIEEPDVDDDFEYEELGERYKKVHAKIKVLEKIKKSLKKMLMGKLDDDNREQYESNEVSVSKTRNQYERYNPETVIENVPNNKLSDVLKVKKRNLKNIDLHEESRAKIEDDTEISFSNPYVRVSKKEE